MSILRYGLPLYCPLRFKEDDPRPSSIEKIKVVFNDCLRLLTNRKRQDHGKIKDMLNELDWLSINQLCAETRLVEAWKTVHFDNYCMKDTVKIKEKSKYISTRSDDQTLLETGQNDKFTNGSFVHLTAKAWNCAPKSVKEAAKLHQA